MLQPHEHTLDCVSGAQTFGPTQEVQGAYMDSDRLPVASPLVDHSVEEITEAVGGAVDLDQARGAGDSYQAVDDQARRPPKTPLLPAEEGPLARPPPWDNLAAQGEPSP